MKGRVLELGEHVSHLKAYKSLVGLGAWKQDISGGIIDTNLKLESL